MHSSLVKPLMRALTLLGATGSIGDSTLDVVARHPDRFMVAALAAQRRLAKSWPTLCRRHRPQIRGDARHRDARAHRSNDALAAEGMPTRVLAGDAGLAAVAALPESIRCSRPSSARRASAPTLAAARAGKRILLANKEALVIGGAAVHAAAVEAGGATLLADRQRAQRDLPMPAAQATTGDPAPPGIRRILLTASGRPVPHALAGRACRT